MLVLFMMFQIKQRQHNRRYHEFSREEALEAEQRRKEEREAQERRRQQEAEAPKEKESQRGRASNLEKTTTTRRSRRESKSSSSVTKSVGVARGSDAAAICRWSGATKTTPARRTTRSTRSEPRSTWPSARATWYVESWNLEGRAGWTCVSSGRTTATWSRCCRFVARRYEEKSAGTHR